jgi:hypothetical protein
VGEHLAALKVGGGDLKAKASTEDDDEKPLRLAHGYNKASAPSEKASLPGENISPGLDEDGNQDE